MDDAQKQQVKEHLNNNKHEAYVLSVEELDKVVQVTLRSPSTNAQKAAWDVLRGKLEAVANYAATGQDLITLTKVFVDLGFAGTKAYVKYYNGKAYVVFKGNPRLWNLFTGTRYGLQNAKIVQMGLGKHGAVNAAKGGGILTIILVGAFRVIDYILTDQATLTNLIGSLATDVVKVGIATGAAMLAGMAAAAVFTVAIGPLVAAIVVGTLVSFGLSKLDTHYALTEKVIAALDELEGGIEAVIQAKKRAALAAVNDLARPVIDYAVSETRRIIINTAKHYLPAMPSL